MIHTCDLNAYTCGVWMQNPLERERNPLGPDTSRSHAPARRKVNTGG